MATCLTCGRDFLGSSATDTVCPQCVSAAPPLGRAIVTPILLGILTLVYVLMVVSGVSPVEPTIGSLVSWGADFGPYTLSGEWWRTLTSTFLHIGFLHLAFNGWCLWRLGRMAEPPLGSGRFAALYLLSGLGGSLVSRSRSWIEQRGIGPHQTCAPIHFRAGWTPRHANTSARHSCIPPG